MKNIYLELGVHSSYWTDLFLKEHPDKEWEVHWFECAPVSLDRLRIQIDELKDFNIILHPVAVSTENAEKSFYRGRSQSSTLFEGRTSRVSYEDPSIVTCIDFNEWVVNNLSLDDYVYMSMDVEGAEYDIIPHLIENDTLKYFDDMVVEFHAHKFRGENGERFSQISLELFEYFKEHEEYSHFNLWNLYKGMYCNGVWYEQ